MDDEFIHDDELLIEAARYFVRRGITRNSFMTQAKRAWYAADAEKRGQNYADYMNKRAREREERSG